jgi:hypothetical protein
MRSRYCRWGGFFTVLLTACGGGEVVDRVTWLRTHDAGASRSPNPNLCLQSRPIFGDNSGYEQCQSGMIHRVQRFACPSSVPRPDFNAPDGGLTEYECRKDGDCSALGAHSYCKFVAAHMGPPNAYVCVKGCVDDSGAEPVRSVSATALPGLVPAKCSSDGECARRSCAPRSPSIARKPVANLPVSPRRWAEQHRMVPVISAVACRWPRHPTAARREEITRVE